MGVMLIESFSACNCSIGSLAGGFCIISSRPSNRLEEEVNNSLAFLALSSVALAAEDRNLVGELDGRDFLIALDFCL